MRISDWSSDVCSSDLNYLSSSLTIFIEPICDQFEVPAGGEAVVTLEDGRPHSIDVHPDNWISIWNEGPEFVEVEIFDEHQFSFPGKPKAYVCFHPCRSEERRVGTVCVVTCSTRWWPVH